MATETVPQGAPAPILQKSIPLGGRPSGSERDHLAEMSPAGLHKYAHGVLQEIGEEEGRAFAVAAAGARYVPPSDVNARALFEVVQDILGDAALTTSLACIIDQMARRAGSQLTSEEARGDNARQSAEGEVQHG